MKITIEESPQSKWIFDTDEIPSERLRTHLLKSADAMLAPIRTHMYEHGRAKILSAEICESVADNQETLCAPFCDCDECESNRVKFGFDDL